MVRWHYDLVGGLDASKMVEELLENDSFACGDSKSDVRNLPFSFPLVTTAVTR
jgi:hypothetical protein